MSLEPPAASSVPCFRGRCSYLLGTALPWLLVHAQYLLTTPLAAATVWLLWEMLSGGRFTFFLCGVGGSAQLSGRRSAAVACRELTFPFACSRKEKTRPVSGLGLANWAAYFRGDLPLAGSARRLSCEVLCKCFSGFLPALRWAVAGEDKPCCFGCPLHSPSRISWNSSPYVLLLRLPLALPATSSERALSTPRARRSGT